MQNEIQLPEGKWRYWFDDAELIEGPTTFSREFPLDEYPLYIREGSIIPMDIKRSYTGIGEAEDEGFLTFRVFPSVKQNSFEVFRENGNKTRLEYEMTDHSLEIILSGEHCPHILQVHLLQKPHKLELDDKILIEEKDYSYDEASKKLRIKTEKYENGAYLIEL